LNYSDKLLFRRKWTAKLEKFSQFKTKRAFFFQNNEKSFQTGFFRPLKSHYFAVYIPLDFQI
jgi:hypothetical protein